MTSRTWIGLGGPSINRTRPVSDKAEAVVNICNFDLLGLIEPDPTDLLSTFHGGYWAWDNGGRIQLENSGGLLALEFTRNTDLLSTVTDPFDLLGQLLTDSVDLESDIDDSPIDLDGDLC